MQLIRSIITIVVAMVPMIGSASALKVVALHPLMADLARQVGGDKVGVFDLVGESGNPHRFEPRPADLRKLQEADLVLAGGKNLEPYLDRVSGTLGGITIVEVGRTIPSLTVGKDAVYSCCPAHAAGGIDPHWWHGVENMRRAARVVAQALAEKDPANRDTYMANSAAYSKRLGELKEWAKTQLARVPRSQRTLVTAHNAFAYFAKEFGFDVIAVAGLTKEQNTTPQELANTIATVKAARIQAIFPEHAASPKILESIAAETGARIGHPLIADGNGSGQEAGFEAMIRHNVTNIVESLTTP